MNQQMMNHISDAQLNEFLDNALPDDMRRTVSQHLGSCPSCRARLDELRLVFDGLAALPELRISHDFTPAILSWLPEKQGARWSPVFAAQFITVLGLILWLSSRAASFIKLPTVPSFHIDQLTSPWIDQFIPTINIQSLAADFLFTLPKFQFLTGFPFGNTPYSFSIPHLPVWVSQMPFSHFQLSSFPMAAVGIVAFLFWLFINAVLLRGSAEVKK